MLSGICNRCYFVTTGVPWVQWALLEADKIHNGWKGNRAKTEVHIISAQSMQKDETLVLTVTENGQLEPEIHQSPTYQRRSKYLIIYGYIFYLLSVYICPTKSSKIIDPL